MFRYKDSVITIVVLILLLLVTGLSALAQEPPTSPRDSDDDGIPDWGDPDNINIPAERELPTDRPIFPAIGGVEDAAVSNVRLVVFRSDKANQMPLRIRYCPTQALTCSVTQANEILGQWSVNTWGYIDYDKCFYDAAVKYYWCLVVNRAGVAYFDPNPTDKYLAGYVAIADADSRRVWMRSR